MKRDAIYICTNCGVENDVQVHIKATTPARRRKKDDVAVALAEGRDHYVAGAVIRAVAGEYKTKVCYILGREKDARIVEPRAMAMYIVRRLTEMSYPQIAFEFDKKNHTTVLHACRRVDKIIELAKHRRRLNNIMDRLGLDASYTERRKEAG